MRKRALQTTGSAIAIGVWCMLAAPACSDRSSRELQTERERGAVGGLGLSLTLGGEYQLDTLHYEITGNGLVRSGDLAVTGPGDTFSAQITELPAGMGYTIKLSGLPYSAPAVGCAAMRQFDIASRETTQLGVVLVCDELDESGAVVIDGHFNVCPKVQGTTVTPVSQSVGSSVAMTVTARDADQQPGPLAYTWTATSGTLTGDSTASPSLLCTAQGTVSIELLVSDGQCTRSSSITVQCTAASDAPDAGISNASTALWLTQLEDAGVLPRLDRTASLAGPDVDGNGIRDDIDSYIAVRGYSALELAAVRQYARAMQQAVAANANSIETARLIEQLLGKAIHCVWRVWGEPNASERISQVYEELTANTEPRVRAYLQYNHLLNGRVLSSPRGDTCEN